MEAEAVATEPAAEAEGATRKAEEGCERPTALAMAAVAGEQRRPVQSVAGRWRRQ